MKIQPVLDIVATGENCGSRLKGCPYSQRGYCGLFLVLDNGGRGHIGISHPTRLKRLPDFWWRRCAACRKAKRV